MSFHKPLSILVFALLAALLAGCAATAPKPQLWDRWTAHDERDRRDADSTAWAQFLQRYLVIDADGVERVRYAAVSGEDRARLDAWLRLQQQQRVSMLSLRAQRAYWLNLYNAGVVALVLGHAGIDSLDALQPRPWQRWLQRLPWSRTLRGPFAEPRFTVEGQPLSLDDIEHRILRPRWRDWRTDYALCKARLDSPALAPEPYAGEHLDEQLEARANAWVASPHALHLDRKGGLQLSVFWRRYRADFGDEAAVLAELHLRAVDAQARQLAGVGRVAGYFEDPALNTAP